MNATQTQMAPPNRGNNKVIAAGFDDDEVRQIVYTIGNMSKSELAELHQYLTWRLGDGTPKDCR